MRIRPQETALTTFYMDWPPLGTHVTGHGIVPSRVVAQPSSSTLLIVPDGWRYWLWIACDLVDGLAS